MTNVRDDSCGFRRKVRVRHDTCVGVTNSRTLEKWVRMMSLPRHNLAKKSSPLQPRQVEGVRWCPRNHETDCMVDHFVLFFEDWKQSVTHFHGTETRETHLTSLGSPTTLVAKIVHHIVTPRGISIKSSPKRSSMTDAANARAALHARAAA